MKEGVARQTPACTSQLTVSVAPTAPRRHSRHDAGWSGGDRQLRLGAVWSGCIVSGCLCNRDVHGKAKFSIMMCSDALKTLVYSFSLLIFGQHIVYMMSGGFSRRCSA